VTNPCSVFSVNSAKNWFIKSNSGACVSDRCDASAPQGCQMSYFQTKNPDLGKFWRVLQWKVLVYMSIWYISCLFGISCGQRVYFMVVWYICSPFWYVVVPWKIWQPCWATPPGFISLISSFPSKFNGSSVWLVEFYNVEPPISECQNVEKVILKMSDLCWPPPLQV
jgi:hypothetical protein